MDKNLIDISGFEGLYAVSENGDIWSYPKKNGPRMSTGNWLNKELHNGYLYVSLCKKGKYTKRLVHRLVAETFIPNCFNKGQVNHIDGEKTNNSVTNLEWVTPSENCRHAYKIGLSYFNGMKGEKNPRAKLTERDVVEMRKLDCPYSVIVKKFGVSKSVVHSVMTRKSWKHI